MCLTGDAFLQIDPFNVFVEVLVQVIQGNHVFQTVQNLQRSLDTLDIEGLLKYWTATRKIDPSFTSNTGGPFSGVEAFEPTLNDWVDFVDQYLTSNCPPADVLPTQHGLKFFLLSYLLSTTFKDCSIIAKFQPNCSEAHLHIIDLDPKSIMHLDKWAKQDREIVQTFQQRVQNEDISSCIDDNFVWS
jgi:inositol-pentakisphosphate 2-kinase